MSSVEDNRTPSPRCDDCLANSSLRLSSSGTVSRYGASCKTHPALHCSSYRDCDLKLTASPHPAPAAQMRRHRNFATNPSSGNAFGALYSPCKMLPFCCEIPPAEYNRISFRQVPLPASFKVPSIIHPWYSSCCRINPCTKEERSTTGSRHRFSNETMTALPASSASLRSSCRVLLSAPQPNFSPPGTLPHPAVSLQLLLQCKSASYAARLVPAPAENILVHLNGQLFQMQTVYFLFFSYRRPPCHARRLFLRLTNTCSPHVISHSSHCSFSVADKSF